MSMNLNNLRPSKGARNKRKRVGRGEGSGTGVTAGRGNKGQKSRSGYKSKRGFDEGQMPIQRQLPKRGFHNPFRVEYAVVNLDTLAERFDDGAEVTPEILRERKIVRKANAPIKVLARGEISKKLTVKAHRFSVKASAAITASGGSASVLSMKVGSRVSG